MTSDALSDTLRPLHAQLRDAILAAIASGDWAPDARIASERELCDRYGVSRTTARRAVADLVYEGVLVAVGGKGTFVRGGRPLRQELQPLVGFAQDLAEQGLDVHARVLDLSRIEADATLAAALDLRPASPVVRLRRLRLSGDTALAIQTSCLPEHLCPGLLRLPFERRSLYTTLRDEYGLHLVEGSTVIHAARATPEEGRLLGLDDGGAVLRTTQTTRLASGEVIERCDACFPGDRFQLTVGGAGGVSPVYAAARPDA